MNPKCRHSEGHLQGQALSLLLDEIQRLTDVDLGLCRPEQVKRLLESTGRRYGAENYLGLLRYLRDDSELLREFKGRMGEDLRCR
ncbi:MAG: hypothetical protein R6U70_00555 [Bacillota bacterium]